jgi:hypothetical protein
MLRKLILIFLILLAPLQAWAVVEMSFKHTSVVATAEGITSPHPCHQEAKTSSTDSRQDHNQTVGNECNSCVLCMSFAHFSYQLPESPTSYVLTFSGGKTSFVSHQTPAPNKPPIL